MYKLLSFDGVTLPTRNAEMPLDTGDVTPGIVAAGGGAYDRYGTRQVLPQLRRISYTAGYAAADDAAARALLDALRAKEGVRGQLIRVREDAVQQWIYARLLSVNGAWRNEGRRYFAVTCIWETAEATWRSATATTVGRSLSSGSQTLSVVVGGAAPVTDAIVQIGATSGTITAGTISVAALGVQLIFAGTINAGTVAIDAGAMTVKRGTVDWYAYFATGSSHTAYGWLPLTPGTHTVTIAVNGAGTAIVTQYDRWL
jgi:hypothetical protein